MIKKIVIAIVYCTTCVIFAQNGTVSPYSFGIGDIRSVGTVENQMMGGVGIYADSIHINLQNPAAYSKLALTTYTAGISRREIRLKTYNEQENASVSSLDYLSIGLPLGKGFGMGVGLMPFTSIGYNLLSESVDPEGAEVVNAASGDGGLNRVYLSLGYLLFKDVSVGATVNFDFGTLNNQRIQTIENVQFGTLDRRESSVNGFNFNLSANYTPLVTDKYRLHAFVGVATQSNLVAENNRTIGTFSRATGQDVEVVDVDLDAQNLRHTELKIPTTTSLGLGIGEDKKWFMGAEYGFQKLSSFENTFVNSENIIFEDASYFGFGGFFIPEYTSFTNYFKRITYRAGARLTKTGMVVNEKEINNFGITFGVGLPLGGSFSNLNVGFELGRRGTTDAALVEESYLKINLGLSLNDRWFVQRKIN
ncbi:MAG: hypothetical protein V7724_16465 [Sediminicola sp.]|tara:strand:+ start:129065 stop:130327 length:1263 start_codon:yes stop_codon:yes gene_type:complete